VRARCWTRWPEPGTLGAPMRESEAPDPSASRRAPSVLIRVQHATKLRFQESSSTRGLFRSRLEPPRAMRSCAHPARELEAGVLRGSPRGSHGSRPRRRTARVEACRGTCSGRNAEPLEHRQHVLVVSGAGFVSTGPWGRSPRARTSHA
jgi:hypothetical protein